MDLLYNLLILIAIVNGKEKHWTLVGNPQLHALPCQGDDNISITFEAGRSPEEENQYDLYIGESVPKFSQAWLTFDSPATVELYIKESARISAQSNNKFHLSFFNDSSSIGMNVRGPPGSGIVPYVTSININHMEYCEKPLTGFLDSSILGYKNKAETSLTVPDDTCGRRKVVYTELITNGLETKAGDWPWHAAIYRLDKSTIKYICGGTLVDKNYVLTAAHCTTIRGSPVQPEILTAVLGKFQLIGGDVSTQEKEILQIIVHKDFTYPGLSNDLALLKLKSEVKFSDYVQPACLWYPEAYKKLGGGQMLGTVVGWGFDQTDNLSSHMRQATIPKVADATCIKSNPVFYSEKLNSKTFCAGFLNGTSPCNGDSGGGFLVFVPDESGDKSPSASGAWHVRGIVSLSLARRDAPLCDPYKYVVFTDVAKYRGWILSKIG